MSIRFALFSMLFAFLIITACPSKKPSVNVQEEPQSAPVPLPEPIPDPFASFPYVYSKENRFYFEGKELLFKGANYYPVKNNWRKMWEVWDISPIEKEIGLLEGIGVNTVRIFLDYELFERHRAKGDDSIMLARLDELLAVIDKHNMRALLTPFVWGRGNLKTDRLHIRHIASRYKNDKRVFGWDISNELDHCWINTPSRRTAIQEWAEGIYETLKDIDKNHLVTVGDYGWYLGNRDNTDGAGINIDLSLMSLPAEKQDFICFHWYSHYYALNIALEKLTSVISKPIVIEEIGLPTGGLDDSGAPWYLTEEQVAGYFRAWMDVADKHKVYLMPWCGFDYEPGSTTFADNSHQLFFGLFATDYHLKANGITFQDAASLTMKLKAASLPQIKECRRRDK
jgi:hypothetical protein